MVQEFWLPPRSCQTVQCALLFLVCCWPSLPFSAEKWQAVVPSLRFSIFSNFQIFLAAFLYSAIIDPPPVGGQPLPPIWFFSSVRRIRELMDNAEHNKLEKREKESYKILTNRRKKSVVLNFSFKYSDHSTPRAHPPPPYTDHPWSRVAGKGMCTPPGRHQRNIYRVVFWHQFDDHSFGGGCRWWGVCDYPPQWSGL